MSVGEIVCRDAREALDALEGLTGDGQDYVFRGHDEPEWRLAHTFNRFQALRPGATSRDLDGLIERFRVSLARVGAAPIPGDDRQDWMEYGRHYGLPMPCLDFTYSPYIALFFAYAGGWETPRRRGDQVEINALNLEVLGREWARLRVQAEPDGPGGEEIFRRFRFPEPPLFRDGFPEKALQFIPFPSRHNSRMQQQLGALLYDTLDYADFGSVDLEEFLERIQEPDGTSHALVKVYAPFSCQGDIFRRLELMGLTGGRLFQDAYGAVVDAVNSYSYRSRALALRDVVSPPRRE